VSDPELRRASCVGQLLPLIVGTGISAVLGELLAFDTQAAGPRIDGAVLGVVMEA
jgi:hypothetical protein